MMRSLLPAMLLCLCCAGVQAAELEAAPNGGDGTTIGDGVGVGGGAGPGVNAGYGWPGSARLGAPTRIKDIVTVNGVRSNQLVGYGLVVGLNGTGDGLRNSPFTEQSLQSMLDRMGVNVRKVSPKTRNVAAVIVTAELPAFIGRGSRIDVTVSSLGDATSLVGGSLIMTPLAGPDNEIYAVAQGPIAVSGFTAGGAAETVTQNVPTSARIPNGAHVEREPPSRFAEDRNISLELRNPDFGTAVRIADAINAYTLGRHGFRSAQERDLRTISLITPRNMGPARFLAEIGDLLIQPDSPARVVIDERTGTIVIGNDVHVSTVAVAHGSLTVRVTETPQVSQPTPFSEGGETVVTPQTMVTADQAGGKVAIVEGPNLQTLVGGLNRMGLKPASIIAILQAIKTAGALQADLVVQ
jgi:flagellar P-ring protein precursor FlgI